MQQALFPAEDKQTGNRSYRISKPRCNSRAADPHIQSGNKHIIKRHIQNAARHRTDQGKERLFAGNHIKRKVVHQKDRHSEYQITAQIFHTVSFYSRRKVHPGKNKIHCQIPCRTHDKSHHNIYDNQESKIFLCLIRFLLSHFFHNDRAASGGEHGRDCRDKLDHRRREIDR